MSKDQTVLQQRIESGASVLIAEVSPAASGDPSAIVDVATCYAGKVTALGISDNRDHVGMSPLAAAALALGEGVEPILHMVTRDRNRIALASDYLGARALGIGNFLCTTGTHQTLGTFNAARNVFDLDSTQLIRLLAGLGEEASAVGAETIATPGPACLGGVAAINADPIEMQGMRTAKKVAAGSRFLITQPIFDTDRFQTWWKIITNRGLESQTAIIAGIRILTDAESAKAYATSRPTPRVPDAVVAKITGRDAGIAVAVETIHQLSQVSGLRGFEICGGGDDQAVLEVIEKAGLSA